MKTVYIEDVADALEATMEEWNQFLNTETGEFVSLPDGDLYGNWSEDDEMFVFRKMIDPSSK